MERICVKVNIILIILEYDYINFSRINTITNNAACVAKSTNKYTLQFWMYVYNYIGSNFLGINMTWDKHNKISVAYDSGSTSYKFTCWPFYDSASPGTYTQNYILTVANINQWNFISCSVDNTANKLFHVMTDTIATVSTAIIGSTIDLSALGNSSNFSIQDISTIEYGVLFFSQIRLWHDAFISAGFLSRVNIATVDKFNNLRHLFNPTYSNANAPNQKLIDGLVTPSSGCPARAADITITYVSDAATKGANVIDDSLYSVLTLSPENGQYYDPATAANIRIIYK